MSATGTCTCPTTCSRRSSSTYRRRPREDRDLDALIWPRLAEAALHTAITKACVAQGSLADVAELLGDTKRVAREHYIYAMTDYSEADYSIALARAQSGKPRLHPLTSSGAPFRPRIVGSSYDAPRHDRHVGRESRFAFRPLRHEGRSRSRQGMLRAMDAAPFPELSLLSTAERSCLARYLDLLASTLGGNLRRVVVFGSVARGESWPQGMPIRSDLDLLVVVRAAVAEVVIQQLLNATLPLYLECGRQISPQFRTEEQLRADDERSAVFREHVTRDGVAIFGD